MAPRRTAPIALAPPSLVACGDDGDDQIVAPADDETTTTTAAGELPDACELVPDAATTTGLDIPEGAQVGNEERSVCAHTVGADGEIGLTLAVQGGSRFDEKAEQSEAATGPGEAVDGVGDRALFFYDDEDIPEGVGGVLVEVGDLTVDVTLQGLDEATMRDAAVALAEEATANL